jgi:hypothetical protein
MVAVGMTVMVATAVIFTWLVLVVGAAHARGCVSRERAVDRV